jgi:ABC-type sugar transport system substrate-binding protein
MRFTRRAFKLWRWPATALFTLPAMAQDMPAPFDKPGDVKIALVRYLSTGDFFQAYLAGVEAQAKALGVTCRCSTAARTQPCRPTWSTRRLRSACRASSSSTA